MTTTDYLQDLSLSLDATYYLFVGSYADKWHAASLLPEKLSTDQRACIIADTSDADLLRVFIGPEMRRVRLADSKTIKVLHNAARQDSAAVTSRLKGGLIQSKRGIIQSLHVVDYPYFITLHARRAVRNIDLLLAVLALPANTRPAMPSYYTPADVAKANEFMLSGGLDNTDNCIVHATNITNEPLDARCYQRILEILLANGYKVAFNVAGMAGGPLKDILMNLEGSRIIEVPGYLMKLVFDATSLCIGANGGALFIADSFSSCSYIAFATKTVFYPDYNEFADIDLYEYENHRAYPRIDSERKRSYISLVGMTASDALTAVENATNTMIARLTV